MKNHAREAICTAHTEENSEDIYICVLCSSEWVDTIDTILI